MRGYAIPFIFGVLLCHVADAFEFIPGDFYGTHYFSREIVHYSALGAVIESMSVPPGIADDVKGLAFGPDDLLYAVADRDGGFAVLALDASGNVHQSYDYGSLGVGNLSSGKIAFDQNGNFYVGDAEGLVRFTVGASGSGTRIRTTPSAGGGVYDVEVIPGGNLLIVESYRLYELTNTGAEVREIDPANVDFVDNRGVEYDPYTGSIFVTMLGIGHSVLKLDGTTGQLLHRVNHSYADDMYLAEDGRLVVGSRTQSPAFFTQSPSYLGSFDGGDRMFITQFPIPEPSTGVLFLAAFSIACRRRRTTTSPCE